MGGQFSSGHRLRVEKLSRGPSLADPPSSGGSSPCSEGKTGSEARWRDEVSLGRHVHEGPANLAFRAERMLYALHDGAAHNKGGQKGEGADMGRKWSFGSWRRSLQSWQELQRRHGRLRPHHPATADAGMQWNIIAIVPIVRDSRTPGFRDRQAEHRRRLRSTWAWSRERCMTPSTRSRRSITGRTS